MIRFLFAFLLLISSAPLISAAPESFSNAEAYTVAQSLTHRGELRIREGFVYVKVDDRFIHDIFPLLTQPNLKKPAYFRRVDAPGAHISVFYEEETKKVGTIHEVGKNFTFEMIEFRSVKIQQGKEVFLIACRSPELEALRKKYGLKPLLQGHDFHITIAVRHTKKPSVK